MCALLLRGYTDKVLSSFSIGILDLNKRSMLDNRKADVNVCMHVHLHLITSSRSEQ